jgi:hypothetical protein
MQDRTVEERAVVLSCDTVGSLIAFASFLISTRAMAQYALHHTRIESHPMHMHSCMPGVISFAYAVEFANAHMPISSSFINYPSHLALVLVPRMYIVPFET